MLDLEKIRLSTNLDLFAKQVVEGFITGKHRSPYHGFSVEFSEHRLYNLGENPKHIDWKLFARSDKLFVKRYQEETNLRCQLILDVSSSMYYPSFKNLSFKNPNKLFFSTYAAAVLINLLKKQRDAVGLTLFSEKIDLHIPPKSTLRHQKLIYHNLEKCLNIDSIKNVKKTNSISSVHEISEMLHRRSLVMIFTDLINNESDVDKQFESFKHLKYNKHEVILFYLSEPLTEINFDFNDTACNFIDVETGEKIKLNPNQYKEEYQKKSKKYLSLLKLKCLQYKIDLVEVDINKGFDQILLAFLLKRQKMF
tara:strand:- start:639 stop:1565 length:927 start_codon:yes stop_codon:yes gene_type:complete